MLKPLVAKFLHDISVHPSEVTLAPANNIYVTLHIDIRIKYNIYVTLHIVIRIKYKV